MNSLDLRPLSLGEILDRAFTLYRRHFLLFIGISAVPNMLVLAAGLAQWLVIPMDPGAKFNASSLGLTVALALVILLVSLFAYVFSQGGTILAVSELYLGRQANIGDSLKGAFREMWPLIGVLMLSGMAIGMGFIFLIVPGVYLACRLLVVVPSTLVEKRGPGDALSRSFDLTRDHAGRAFLIFLMSVVMQSSASAIFSMPFTVLMVLSAKNPELVRIFAALSQVGSTIAVTLVNPMMLIATSIFYFDLRVRKEAFDLQYMLDQNAQAAPGLSTVPPSIL